MIEIHPAALTIMLAFVAGIMLYLGYRLGWAMHNEQAKINERNRLDEYHHGNDQVGHDLAELDNVLDWNLVPPAPETYDRETERLDGELVQLRITPGYSHAENILVRLRDLEKRYPTDAAIRIAHREFINPEY